MFFDQTIVYAKAGDGGNGIIAFRREKFVPRGGPAGGDGGNGGDIIFKVDEGLNTLVSLRYNRHFKADRGENGMNKGKHGKNAEPLVVHVPPGTVIYDDETNELLADLTEEGEEAIIAKGGRGGRGNTRFATARNPAPQLAENGEPGEERTLRVELKLIADVGLIGLPNVGKSTLLSVVSEARPKIANYHFTTLAPNLGVVEVDETRTFVLADLPGLIEGAHEGVGLGHQFLRHVERTRLLVHVLDMASTEGRDPIKDYESINEELYKYDENIRDKRQIVVANKMDMPKADEQLTRFINYVGNEVEIIAISALTRKGITKLIYKIAELLETIPKDVVLKEESEVEVPVVDVPFTITRTDDATFVLSGEQIERMYQMADLTTTEGMQRFARQLRHLGVDDALREHGAHDGDIVRLVDMEFEFVE